MFYLGKIPKNLKNYFGEKIENLDYVTYAARLNKDGIMPSRKRQAWNYIKSPLGIATAVSIAVPIVVAFVADNCVKSFARTEGAGYSFGRGIDPDHNLPDNRIGMKFSETFFPNLVNGTTYDVNNPKSFVVIGENLTPDLTRVQTALDAAMTSNAGAQAQLAYNIKLGVGGAGAATAAALNGVAAYKKHKK